MRRILAILLTVFIFGFALACDSSTCSDSGGTPRVCPNGYYAIHHDDGSVECVYWLPTATPTATPTGTSTADPTETAEPTATTTATPTATTTATTTPTTAPTATPTATATVESNCYTGIWKGDRMSDGGKIVDVTANITQNGTSLTGTITITDGGVQTTFPATGTVNPANAPGTFKFGKDSETQFSGNSTSCSWVSGTYTDTKNGEKGTWSLAKQ